MITRPFHAGEQALQQRVGDAARLAETGPRAIRDQMPEQHRSFFETLPFVLVGSLDRAGRVWASVLSGAPGFVQSPDAQSLHIQARPIAGDPLAEAWVVGSRIGLLGIEAQTRRRNRANGTIVAVDDGGIRLQVAQSFGNCPRYIREREAYFVRDRQAAMVPASEGFTTLDTEACALIAAADTCFVASHAPGAADDPARGSDVSHRGGRPGFVRVEDERTLLVPDFAGNRYYMTLGNLLLDGRAGLLFIDFERGDLLSLSGRAELVEGGVLTGFEGAERGWRLHLQAGLRHRDALPLRWRQGAASPHSTATGTWPGQSEAS